MNVFLSTAYFPNIQYFSKIINSNEIFIEQYENFPKQTYRNRCKIIAANGILPLVVPVTNGRSGKVKTKDIKIAYVENWQHQHYQSIMSAYSSAPFYDYYMPELENIFKKKYKFLLDLNEDILLIINELLTINTKIKYTDDFLKDIDSNYKDFRFSITPKKQIIDKEFNPKSYIQVFSDRFDFQENMSILDLLFNLGPDSRKYLLDVIF